jgi:hypothetical protein
MRWLALIGLLAGCHGAVRHLPKNAPGVIVVAEPPRPPEKPGDLRLDPPGDPGEEMLIVSAGPLYGGGMRIDGDGEVAGHGWLTGELSILHGWNSFSHNKDDFFIYPFEAWGLNFGFTFLEDDDAQPGNLYIEVQRTTKTVVTYAAGIAFDADDRAVGPQLSASFASLYLRGAYLYDRGVELQIGMVWKLPAMWVWSR